MQSLKLPTPKLVCSCIILLANAVLAQDASDWLWHIRAGPMVGLNISARFSSTGPFNLAANQPPGVYDDGYVHPDQTGNTAGLTSYWGYQSGSQVNSASHTLLMHQTTTYSANSSTSAADEPYFGAEVAGGGDIWRWNQWRVGWEVGCGVLPISINNHQNFPTTVNRSIYSFNTGNIVVPTAPYNGGPSGIGPLISATGTQVGADTLAGTFSGSQNLQAILVAIKLGPTLFWDMSRHVGIQASVGPAVGILPGSLKFDDTVQLADGIAPHTSARFDSTPVSFGGYVNLVAIFHVGKNVDVYLGGQYMPLENANFNGDGRSAELKMTGQVNFMAGLNWPF